MLVFRHEGFFLWRHNSVCSVSIIFIIKSLLRLGNHILELHIVMYTSSTQKFNIKDAGARFSQTGFNLWTGYNDGQELDCVLS